MKKHRDTIEYEGKIIPIPRDNALSNLSLSQKIILLFIFGLLLYIFNFKKHYFNIFSCFYYPVTVLYLVICAHKFLLIAAGYFKKTEVTVSDIEIASNQNWPLYTILLPVYRETSIFEQLYSAIENIYYPKNRLEVLLLIEEDDTEFKEFLQAQKLPPWWEIVEIPDFKPKTKGKALNFGLLKAGGDYLVIYDAEDIPEKNQLKKAVLAFRKLHRDVVCLQSKLNYYNPYQNMLTKWFTAEYSSWFDLYLPGINAVNAPMPLGGTSNHFKREKLLELRGWDPFNVTEDCDLGIRIFKAHYSTKVLDTTTWEEANSVPANWLKQRSRWVKGYIQTYLVNMRNPAGLIKKIGIMKFFHFNAIVGGNVFVLCFNPVAWTMIILWLLKPGRFYFPNAFLLFSTAALLAGNFFFIMINVWGVLQRKWYRLAFTALFSPLYWFLMSAGAWKGLFQFLRKPHFWEKTEHALFKNHRSRIS